MTENDYRQSIEDLETVCLELEKSEQWLLLMLVSRARETFAQCMIEWKEKT